ncbi:pyridoxamine 5'-phosphate oxidase family protein [Pricia sp.]|uniref:pyridoxamine 5'-phosphate oxidase family protein n=1 Tax=Pricia sp. TaxID=2268138 RepID=UPI003593FB85
MTVLTVSESTNVIRNNYTGHLGYVSQGEPYVIPITYYFDPTDDTLISYSGEGHKIKAMRKNRSVSVQVEEIASMHNWESAMVHGTFEELEGSAAKQKLHEFTEGVKSMIHHKEQKEVEFISEFSGKSYARGTPVVFRIKITGITGKRRES